MESKEELRRQPVLQAVPRIPERRRLYGKIRKSGVQISSAMLITEIRRRDILFRLIVLDREDLVLSEAVEGVEKRTGRLHPQREPYPRETQVQVECPKDD